ncbi:major facilitator superfamily transporter [Xylaria venustula]|nr:major facilitator superfamily transporter [Xylaria venustula]
MSTPDETTSLLHSEQNEYGVGANRDVLVDSPHQETPTKTPTRAAATTDIEANETVPSENDTRYPPKIKTSSLIKVIAVLMIGLFTSSVDGSLVLATHPRIASEFNALEDSSWLFIAFLLAGVATQVLYAKLSDVYGRRYMLVFCYALFGIGCAIIGIAQSMWHVVLGRVLSGSGGSGMASLAMVLITDLIPLRDVASWLGYINIVSTTGRSIGGPLGGILADTVGWRWSFAGQAPLFAIASIASILVIPNTKAPESQRGDVKGLKAWLSRIDFAGSTLFGSGILLLMLPIEIGGVKVPWTHPIVYGLFGAGIIVLAVFVINEARWAEKPAFPLRLLVHKDILLSYFSLCCIAGAQTSVRLLSISHILIGLTQDDTQLMYFVPLYFQVTGGVSNTVAGLHLVPAVMGNAVGGVVAGQFIRRTGRYKAVILGSSLCASIGYALLVARWLGNTNWGESLYIVFGGFGSGMAGSAVFVSIQAVVEPEHKAVANSGLQLAMPIGMLLGVTAGSAVMLDVLQRVLNDRLLDIGLSPENRVEIIKKSIANVDYVRQLPSSIKDIVVGGYVVGLRASFVVILVFSVTGLVAGSFLRERRLK